MSKRRTKVEMAAIRGFHSGIRTALNLLKLHGFDSIYDELIRTCDVKEVVRFAREDGELEWSGLIDYGYAKPPRKEPTHDA